MNVNNIKDLIDILTLEKLDHCLYRGYNYMTPWKRIFGGQVLGQALAAAYDTVPDDRWAHSFHGYFILAGDIAKPVIYQVENIRDGGSFTTRRVTAMQNGKVIFLMAASFQKDQEGFEHQEEMPKVPPPDNLLNIYEQGKLGKEENPKLFEKIARGHQEAIEFRSVEDFLISGPDTKPQGNVWMKTSSAYKMDRKMQHIMLAYASDYNLLITAAYPHRNESNISKLFFASLDHAMYFHRDFDFNDWLLYAVKSPSAHGSKAIAHGHVFSKEGTLVATAIQEGLIRVMR